MKPWNHRSRCAKPPDGPVRTNEKASPKQLLFRSLVWLVVAALCLTCSFTAFSVGAEESAGSGSTADGPSIEELVQNTPEFSMKTDPFGGASTSFSRIGEVLATKNVAAHQGATPQDSSFEVTLSALSSWTNVSGLLSKPLDIVMVLDTSGSMRALFDNTTSRINALKHSVNLFLDSLERSNNQIGDEAHHSNVGIVTYNNAAQVEMPLTDDVDELRNCVNNLKETGVTYSNLGLQEGLKMVQGSLNDNRGKVVIFFTDGMPSDGYGFTRSIADEAVEAADAIRKDGSLVYSVGIFSGSDPNASVELTGGQENTNRFMQAVSSNYPDAGTYSGNLGERASSQYYLSAADPDGLEWDFEYIFQTMDGGSGYPTQTDPAHPESSGYITLHDETGDWMEFSTAPVLQINGQNHVPVSSSTSGNVTTYAYQGQVPTNVPSTTTDLSCVEVTITHGEESQGDALDVRLPAALLPLDVYSERAVYSEQEKTGPTFNVRHAVPFRVSCQVSLNASMKQALTGEKTDESLQAAAWLDGHNPASFYSNRWNLAGGVHAGFTPASTNQFYHGENADPVSLQTATKTDNVTETLADQNRLEVLDESDNPEYRLQLGNNGRLDLQMHNSVTISKTVLSADGYPVPDQAFTFLASLEDSQGNPWNGSLSMTDADGSKTTLDFQDGKAQFTLSGTQKITLAGLPLFASLQVEEQPAEGFTTQVHTHKSERSDSSVSEAVDIHPMTRAQIEFVNTYTLQPITLTPDQSGLVVHKTLNGRDWTDQDAFRFMLSALSPENAPLPEKTSLQISGSDAEKTADFGSITFTTPGVYRYLISENSTGDSLEPGVSSSAALYEVSIPVVDQGNGTLHAEAPVIRQIHNDQGDALDQTASSVTFTNTYSAEQTSLIPMITKRIEAFSSADPAREQVVVSPGDYQFTFTLKTDDEDAPMPAGSQDQSISTVNHGEVVEFPAIVFDQTHIGKTFRYEISEEAVSSIPGMSGSSEKIVLEVTVSRAEVNGTETVVATPRYLNEDGQPLTSENRVLTNHYTYAPATTSIPGVKTLNGRNMKAGEFTFTLSAAGSLTQQAMDNGEVLISQTTASAAAAEEGKPGSFSFDHLQFNQPGDYYFVIEENQDPLGGVILDDALHYVQVYVSHNPSRAALEAEVIYLNAEDVPGNHVTFENTYLPVFDDSTAVSLQAEKKIEDPWNDAGLDNARFGFRLTAPDGSASVLTSLEGVFQVLDNQSFVRAGLYTYPLQEIPIVADYPQEAMIFDESVWTIEIEVTDDGNGTLQARAPRILKDGQPAESIVFTNTVKPIPVQAAALPAAEKQLSGRPLQENEFHFTWTLKSSVEEGVQTDGTTWAKPQTVSNSADGTIPFFAADMTFTKPGHYEITLEEEKGKAPGMAYDETVLTWSYDVTLEEGRLAVSSSWPSSPVFNNTWTSPLQNTVSVPLKAHKELKNGKLKADEFTFELVQDDKVVQTGTNDENGLIVLDPLLFQQEGDYHFILREKKGDRQDIDYDDSQFDIQISVKKDDRGVLKASVASDKALLFINTRKQNIPSTSAHSHWLLWTGLAALAGLLVLVLKKVRKE